MGIQTILVLNPNGVITAYRGDCSRSARLRSTSGRLLPNSIWKKSEASGLGIFSGRAQRCSDGGFFSHHLGEAKRRQAEYQSQRNRAWWA